MTMTPALEDRALVFVADWGGWFSSLVGPVGDPHSLERRRGCKIGQRAFENAREECRVVEEYFPRVFLVHAVYEAVGNQGTR